MKCILIYSYILLFSRFIPTTAVSQESGSTNPDEASSSRVEDQPATPDSTADTAQSGEFEVFIPSEEISEDQSVPFPVDI